MIVAIAWNEMTGWLGVALGLCVAVALRRRKSAVVRRLRRLVRHDRRARR